MPKKISLKQFLMRSGMFDKAYDCIATIKKGKATVDGETITNPSHFLNPKKSHVMLNGRTVRRAKNLYYIMNKPSGYLAQKAENEKTIYDILPAELRKSVFAVGRLDKETEGLIILTNDGKLASLIANPKNKIEKKYHAVLEKPLDEASMEKLRKGVNIEVENSYYMTIPAKIESIGKKEVYIIITEGKKRQVRKMLEALGNKVMKLKRVSIGGITLKGMKPGEIKQMTREDIIEKLEY